MRKLFLHGPDTIFNLAKMIVSIAFALVWLTACNQVPPHPIITDAYISPDPVVGKIVTLHIEVMSGKDAADVTISTLLPDEINLVDGDLEWHGSLKANQPQVHEMSICVLRPGENWRIYLGVASQLSETSSIGDGDILNIESTTDSARVIPSKDYRVTGPGNAVTAIVEAQNATAEAQHATPTPVPPTVSAECSGV
ncbi:MAG: hypothetical protein H6664_03655 [Ardenticatenaceae bacterium]|nr:hypothetical protein [Ardenticatenaceae bacterium]MCB9003441.1 hypothetical protein [Ardenticatenaceae bacterium]